MEDRCFAGLQKIQTINMSSNSLRAIPQTLFPGYDRVHLLELDFSKNEIATIHPNTFSDLRFLQSLDLSRNSLQDLNEQMMAGMRSLRKLYLQHNDLLNIQPRTFKDLINLDVLDLSDNNLQTFSNDIFGGTLPKLRKLFLKSNSITVLQPRSFMYTPNVDYLSLAYNELRELKPDLFEPLDKLRKLHIQHNQVEDLSGEMFNHTKRLQELYISHNRLTFFPDISVDFSYLEKVSLEGNPWQCACYQDMMQYLTRRQINYRGPGSNPYYEGTKPICVVTPAPMGVCIKDLNRVRAHHIVDIYDDAINGRSRD